MTAWLNAVRNAKILPKGAPSYKHWRRLPGPGGGSLDARSNREPGPSHAWLRRTHRTGLVVGPGIDGLDVVIQLELGRHRAHPDVVGLVLALVRDPRIDEVGGEYISLHQERAVCM